MAKLAAAAAMSAVAKVGAVEGVVSIVSREMGEPIESTGGSVPETKMEILEVILYSYNSRMDSIPASS
jgi:hypothetical protein